MMRHLVACLSRLVLGWLVFAAAACAGGELPVQTALSPTFAAVSPTALTALPEDAPTPRPVISTFTPAPSPTAEPPPALWVAPYLPRSFTDGLTFPAGMFVTENPEEATLKLDVGAESPVANWVYAVVAPFPTLTDTVTFADLQATWAGEKTGPFASSPIRMDVKTVGVLEAWWGRAAPGSVEIIPAADLLEAAWESAGLAVGDRAGADSAAFSSWAIVPFEALEPRWKVLAVDGVSPLQRDFNPQAYALTVPFSLTGSPALEIGMPAANRDPDALTVLVMTGVTALVRGTSNTMYSHGVTYPAEEIGPWLRNADITHISNEIPFVENCPLYHPNQVGLVFCTNPQYMGLLEDVGTDVVELTGDHFGDWGPEWTLYTLDLYRERGWPYYGGGENLEDSRRPVLMEHNGNRLAFTGCNAKGGGYATADENVPGAGECDFDWLEGEVRRLVQEGYLPIVTFQHEEIYSYAPNPQMQADFVRIAQTGAVIVSGSQAHQAHGMAFVNGSFVHYGLGNLFFDQYDYYPDQITDRAFIDRHVFYNGAYISTELLTIQFVDLARSRPMTAEERAVFLELVFDASEW